MKASHRILMLELVLKEPTRFDIVHFHIDYLHFPLSRHQLIPHLTNLTTLHGRLDIPDLVPLYKDEFLGNAYALLFPIDWPEPFELVMIEAMACGTPVIAYRSGLVPEVIDDGVTGFIWRVWKMR